MPTKLILLTIPLLMTAACNKKAGTAEARHAHDDAAPGSYLLTTELPPELIEGTPRPLRMPGIPDGQVMAETTSSPGTAGVRYHTVPETASPSPHASRERYEAARESPRQSTADSPLSTFSVDVDTASYSNIRRMIMDGHPIPRDAVRLEEFVNYFNYSYPEPTDGHPFAVHVQNAACPWNRHAQLVRVALKGRELERTARPSANLVLLLDVSGSMNDPRKLPLVVESLRLLIEELNGDDSLAIVVYAGSQGVLLPPTACDLEGQERISSALDLLRGNGSTNGAAGIKLAYQIARDQFKPGGINRVILATDGDFNVGVTSQRELVDLVASNAASHIDLTVISVGTGNLNDAMLEEITNHGNGTYHYIDSLAEGRRVFLDKLMGTLATIAKDVKIQVEFNPARVKSHKLLGYANRILQNEDFSNDRVDAGDIGSGHTVTAFYEVETTEGPPPARSLRYSHQEPLAEPIDASTEWLTVSLRYKQPGGHSSTRTVHPYIGVDRSMEEADADFRFATAVAMTAMALRDPDHEVMPDFRAAALLARTSLGRDNDGRRAEFVELLETLETLEGQHRRPLR